MRSARVSSAGENGNLQLPRRVLEDRRGFFLFLFLPAQVADEGDAQVRKRMLGFFRQVSEGAGSIKVVAPHSPAIFGGVAAEVAQVDRAGQHEGSFVHVGASWGKGLL